MARLFSTAVAAVLLWSTPSLADVDTERLNAVIDARSDDDKGRDGARRPAETLAFFGIEPGMVVVEMLPNLDGPGWYTRVLAPYLGEDGAIYGANYTTERFEKIFGGGFTEERAAQIAGFKNGYVTGVAEIDGAPATVGAFIEDAPPEELASAVDAYLYVRALHHFNRFDPAELEVEAASAFALVKPGGVVGVVQHRAQDDTDDEWARGASGYLKESRVVEAFTGAGFVLEESTELNANEADRPTSEEFVWRLPPTLALGEETQDTYIAIGESDRMTLRFRKPE